MSHPTNLFLTFRCYLNRFWLLQLFSFQYWWKQFLYLTDILENLRIIMPLILILSIHKLRTYVGYQSESLRRLEFFFHAFLEANQLWRLRTHHLRLIRAARPWDIVVIDVSGTLCLVVLITVGKLMMRTFYKNLWALGMKLLFSDIQLKCLRLWEPWSLKWFQNAESYCRTYENMLPVYFSCCSCAPWWGEKVV